MCKEKRGLSKPLNLYSSFHPIHTSLLLHLLCVLAHAIYSNKTFLFVGVKTCGQDGYFKLYNDR